MLPLFLANIEYIEIIVRQSIKNYAVSVKFFITISYLIYEYSLYKER